MVQTAAYIRSKLDKENLLRQAFAHNPERGTPDFRLVLVGHSLGAGTAAILALLLRHEYPNIHCYAYSPPGGLLRYGEYMFFFRVITLHWSCFNVVYRLRKSPKSL